MGLITVFGGTGFLGRRIVERLAGAGEVVRVAARHPARAAAGLSRAVAHRTVPIAAFNQHPGTRRRPRNLADVCR
jgi:uncharacterized protein YbjT (DUF2867 family)